MNFKSVDEILDFAIKNEEKARDFYLGLAAKMEHRHMVQAFKEFADEELMHKQKLLAIKDGKQMESAAEKILDLKIGDYLEEGDPQKVENYQQALILAMQAEKKAFKLYNDLAESTDDENVRNVFFGLAQEEAKHKLRFEVEYDDVILQEN
ncbi:ferritin family protein [candidate division KSB1 bacterium]